MKVIRLKMYQETARFTIHNAPQGVDCYPLPPFSTLNGFIHSMCQWKEYHELNYFVTGKGMYNDDSRQEWHGGAEFGKINAEQLNRWDIITNNPGNKHTGWVRQIKHHSVLVDLNMVIYIKASDDDINDIYKALLNPPIYPSLGEYGDLCRIDDVAIIELKELESPMITRLNAQAYVPARKAHLHGTVYKINYKYEIVGGFRRFNKIDCFLANEDSEVEAHFFDDDKPVIFIN